MPLTPPRRSILRQLKSGDSIVFHHDRGRQYCQSMLTTIQSTSGGVFSQRSAQLIDAGVIHDVTIVTCLTPMPSASPQERADEENLKTPLRG